MVVEIDAHAALALQARDVVEMVVTDQVAAAGPIHPAVDGARVVRLLTHMMDLVELQHVIITVERDRNVWGVMDEVVGSPVADAVDGNAVAIHAVPAAIVVDVVVVVVVLVVDVVVVVVVLVVDVVVDVVMLVVAVVVEVVVLVVDKAL
jgi:hypothetical protein